MNDVLLDTANRKEYREVCKTWAELIVKKGLSRDYGVYAAKLKTVPGWWGIYLGRQRLCYPYS